MINDARFYTDNGGLYLFIRFPISDPPLDVLQKLASRGIICGSPLWDGPNQSSTKDVSLKYPEGADGRLTRGEYYSLRRFTISCLREGGYTLKLNSVKFDDMNAQANTAGYTRYTRMARSVVMARGLDSPSPVAESAVGNPTWSRTVRVNPIDTINFGVELTVPNTEAQDE